MAVFDHKVRIIRKNDPIEEFINIVVDYVDAFNSQQSITLPFSNARYSSKFDDSRVKVTGTAVTGSTIKEAVVINKQDRSNLNVLSDNRSLPCKWIDDSYVNVGSKIFIIETIDLDTGEIRFLGTNRPCESCGLVSMNILILKDNLDIADPALEVKINPYTNEAHYYNGR